jgi:hypothetical protein
MPGSRNGNGNYVGIAPPDEPVRTAYERDLYAWSQDQARLVRDGRWDLVDRENVAEKIESLGRTEFDRMEGALRMLLLHMLKWDHQPQQRSRSWLLSIRAQRIEVEDVLADNPSLKPRLGEALARGYRKARLDAARETGLQLEEFSEVCGYSFDDTMTCKFKL